MLGLLVLLMLCVAIVAYVTLKSGEVLRFETTSMPRQVTMAAVGILGTKRKWATLSQSDGSAQFAYHKTPRWWFVVLLAITIVGFPIAIVYALLAGKKEALVVNTDELGPGVTVVQIASNGWRGKGAGRALRDQVGLAPPSIATIAPTREAGRFDRQAVAEIETQPAANHRESLSKAAADRKAR